RSLCFTSFENQERISNTRKNAGYNKHTNKVFLREFSSEKSKKTHHQIDLSKVPDIKEFMTSQKPKFDHVNLDEPPPYLENAKYVAPPNGKTVYFEMYGCQMNVNDGEYAWAILKEAGYKKTEDLDKADVVLLVTCSIREKAEDRIWKRLGQLRQHKQNYHAVGYPKIGILGCMAERLKKKIVEKEKSVDIVAGPDAYRDLPRLLEQATEDSTTAINTMLSVDETYADVMPVRFDQRSKTAFVSIMRGCDNMCSYCIVPFTRGRERSRPVHSILEEIRMLSDQGIKQVNLLGQNVNSYRDLSETNHSAADLNGTNLSKGFKSIYKPKVGGMRFADLLDKVSRIDEEMRIRFISPHPKDFPDEVLHAISDRRNICKQIHLPAQSGSSNVLQLMRRGHTREDYLDLVDRIRSIIPDVVLSTDIISGFCGETKEDHKDTVSLMDLVKYDYAFLFKYSMRNKTHAYHKMNDDVSEATKSRRLQEIIQLYQNILPTVHQKRIGQMELVLVEKEQIRTPNVLQGRTDGNIKVYIPDCDVITSVTSQEKRKMKTGDYVAVEITSYKPNSYQGIPLFHSSIGSFHSTEHRQ
uniref:Mitochondrial tRNA methylthiotransferase CDK5RAP1 n=1 Tax=Ciona savignyi TaxID=51511 RepID=H2YM88_CIOSA